MEVVLTFVVLGLGIAVACLNLINAILNLKRHKKKDHRSAKR